MIDKNVFTQDLKKVFTILKEIKVVEKYVKELIESDNITKSEILLIKDNIDEIYQRIQDNTNNIELKGDDITELYEEINSIKGFIDNMEQYVKEIVDAEIGVALEGEY